MEKDDAQVSEQAGGIRTRKEIGIERCALKVLRGDFDASAQAHDNSASALVQWTLTATAR
ncbi:2-hydroxychromene-2-carboxylate isomerase [Spinactinospora alkalitolerans]|uniref:2-hydroxychromene-2-carboxylate isomerase n=1 Tax=Spinactinospora alkalitolerans TaxID=687207 RepID=A0A852TU40_9ACTN|nr:hypothetical protein [Spinactinospora alkalitolerans]NYE47549.1 2-hydroxychromene-2-carboxylate isomerase [Spinactinospora alkalitolerans]